MPVDLSEDNVLEVLKQYERKGFTGQFSSRPGACVHCHTCGADEPAAQTPVEAMHRFEGSTNPDDMSILVALECVACGAWGTTTLSYGPEASAEDATTLKELLDARDIGPIHE